MKPIVVPVLPHHPARKTEAARTFLLKIFKNEDILSYTLPVNNENHPLDGYPLQGSMTFLPQGRLLFINYVLSGTEQAIEEVVALELPEAEILVSNIAGYYNVHEKDIAFTHVGDFVARGLTDWLTFENIPAASYSRVMDKPDEFLLRKFSPRLNPQP